jgi:hypothetical protein
MRHIGIHVVKQSFEIDGRMTVTAHTVVGNTAAFLAVSCPDLACGKVG